MTFDQDIAIEGAKLIHALYHSPGDLTINERSTDTQVLILRREGRVFVVLPGTDSFQDWRTDLRATKERFSGGGKIHSGFGRAYRSVIVRIIELLTEMRAEEVVVFGHSLGGAIALPVAYDISLLSSIREVQVYTYGQPRVGNGSFARAYNAQLNSNTFCIVNADDPVPYLPPWLLGFRHAGREVYLDKKGGITVDRSLFSQAVTAAQALQAGYETKGAQAFVSISAHGIGRYLTRLTEGQMA